MRGRWRERKEEEDRGKCAVRGRCKEGPATAIGGKIKEENDDDGDEETLEKQLSPFSEDEPG